MCGEPASAQPTGWSPPHQIVEDVLVLPGDMTLKMLMKYGRLDIVRAVAVVVGTGLPELRAEMFAHSVQLVAQQYNTQARVITSRHKGPN
jgi:hypothetical protein